MDPEPLDAVRPAHVVEAVTGVRLVDGAADLL